MCGIIGYYSSEKSYSLEEAISTIASRGPDDQNVCSLNKVRLGHTRLSIIDIEAGAQPMTDNDNRYCIVFNGEIYNYVELRKELQNTGTSFETNSDTEVILKAYIVWGKKMVKRLDGIFAFAIYDRVKEQIFLGRDRCGVKPLFYESHSGYFAFGSTLDSVTCIKGKKYLINYSALQDYLAFQTVLAPETIFQGVHQLNPAHTITYNLTEGKMLIDCYWDIPSEEKKIAAQDAVYQLDHILTETVKEQMVSEVPIGAFLSGGVDSSLVTHYMAQNSSSQLNTYSVAFDQDSFDETRYALEVSKKYDTKHHVIKGPSMDAESLLEAVSSLDQPLADPAFPMTWYLSKTTKEHITVALSGDGADELFGGYSKFNQLSRIRPKNLVKNVLFRLYQNGLLPGGFCGYVLTEEDWLLYKKVSCGHFPGNRKDLSNFLNEEVCQQIDRDPLEKWSLLVKEYGGFNSKKALMKADIWTYLSENCLVKTDRASMSCGLEVRVPFLGNRVLDFALTTSEETHFSGNSGKQLLKSLAKLHLPESVWNRKKHGFSVPLESFLGSNWKSLTDEMFCNCSEYFPLINAKSIQKMWLEHCKKGRTSRMIYTLLVLLIWARNNQSRIMF
jgi:asparagine synthase (glutamine-hydrolysing)